MDEWIEAVARELGLEGGVDVEALLQLAGRAAHTVERPAAPVTTYLAGVAVGSGADLDDVVRKVSALADNWPSRPH